MNSEEFKEVMGSATVAGPASEELVQIAESKLSLEFPSEYRAFLKEYGAAMGTGFEIAGVFVGDDSGPPLWRDIVKASERCRKSVNGMLSGTMLPISDNGCGTTYYIDASSKRKGGCNVVAYGPGVDGRTVAGSLEEFIVKVARDDIKI